MHLIENWRQSWRWASVRLAIVAGAVSGWAASDPAGFQKIVALLPEWARPLVGPAVAVAAIGSRIFTKKDKADG